MCVVSPRRFHKRGLLAEVLCAKVPNQSFKGFLSQLTLHVRCVESRHAHPGDMPR